MHYAGSCVCIVAFSLALLACTERRPAAASENTDTTQLVQPKQDVSKIPKKAQQYAKYYLHHDNPSRSMAQIEQESSWNPYALSRTGAMGHAQIMPETLEWGAKTFARHLGKPNANNPRYAAEFHEAYMKWFTVDEFPEDHPDAYCLNRGVDEKRYNGGFHIIWELRYSDGTLQGAEKICGTRLPNGKKRSPGNCKENYDYSRHISRRQPKYLSVGGTYCPNN